MHTFKELNKLINNWAIERSLHHSINQPVQRLKLIEEIGELARGILKKDELLITDSLGDVYVVLTILVLQKGDRNLNLDHTHCVIQDNNINNYDYALDLIELVIKYADLKINTSISYLFDLAQLFNHDLLKCANHAWNEIKDRKGKTVNGTFIKN